MKKKAKKEFFTKREKEIFKIYKKEGNGKIVADILGISNRTFEAHMRNIHLKSNTHNTIDLFQYEKENPGIF